jgi:hypothetical protein
MLTRVKVQDLQDGDELEDGSIVTAVWDDGGPDGVWLETDDGASGYVTRDTSFMSY